MGSSLVVRSGLGGWWKAPVAGPPDGVRGGLKGVAARAILPESGGMAERFNAPVLKTGVRKDSWVRIPPPPYSVSDRRGGDSDGVEPEVVASADANAGDG